MKALIKTGLACVLALSLLPSAAFAAPYDDGHEPIGDHAIVIDGILVANKDCALGMDYDPLPGITDNQHLLPVSQAAFDEMRDAARIEAGASLFVLSGYRSAKVQEGLFWNYAARSGEAAANRYSSRPGHSDHQTGLAADIGDTGYPGLTLEPAFGDTNAGQWLANNSWRFGFIMRYPYGKDAITGYQYEPWHFRYVGKDLAAKVHSVPNSTLEEWLGLHDGLGRTIAYEATTPMQLNGNSVNLGGYLIQDQHYYKLRDLAAALEGTPSAFTVDYDSTTHTIVLTSTPAETNKPIEDAVPTETAPVSNTKVLRSAAKQNANVILDGQPLELRAWAVDDLTYINLRDLAAHLHYLVNWQPDPPTIFLESPMPLDTDLTHPPKADTPDTAVPATEPTE